MITQIDGSLQALRNCLEARDREDTMSAAFAVHRLVADHVERQGIRGHLAETRSWDRVCQTALKLMEDAEFGHWEKADKRIDALRLRVFSAQNRCRAFF